MSAFLLLGAGLWLAKRPAGKLEVKLLFVAFTNSPYLRSAGVYIPPETLEKQRTALVMVTNTGTAAAMVYSGARIDLNRWPSNFAYPYISMPPTRLEPARAFFVTVETMDYHQPWFTELLIRRARRNDRTGDTSKEAWDVTKARYFSPPSGEWIQLGPVTNQPPLGMASSRMPPANEQ